MKLSFLWGIVLTFILVTSAFATHTTSTDYDSDGFLNQQDNCLYTPNGGVAGELVEGQSGQFTAEGTTSTITLSFVDLDEAKFTVNGEDTPKLKEREKYFLQDFTQIIVHEIFYQDFLGGIHGASFRVGAQKDTDGNGSGDACPNYDAEDRRASQYRDEFDDLEDEFFFLKEHYRKNPQEQQGKMEELRGKFAVLHDDLRKLMNDIQENDGLDNRKKLLDLLDELEEDVIRVKGRITDLLNQNKSQEQPLPTLSALSASPAPAQPQLVSGLPGGSKVTVFRFSLPSSTSSANSVSEPVPEPAAEDDPEIFWLITAIAIVLIMLLFLILAGMRGERI